MPNIDKEWIKEQLSLSKTTKASQEAIVKLLDAWSEITTKSKEFQTDVVEKFSKLAVGSPIFIPVNPKEVWVPAMPGRISVGDEVLVKEDAFEGDLAPIHNGRRGRVVAIRYGDIIVNSIDGLNPALVGSHYSPYHLLKLHKG
jgi:hypothetical protein